VCVELMPEGPEGDEVRARMQELVSSMRADLARRSPVYGLDRPDLAPRVLGAFDSVGVTLYAGDLLAVDGPMVSVRTAQVRPTGLLELSLVEQLADERSRLVEDAGFDEVPAGPAVLGAAAVHLGDRVLPAEMCEDGVLWAAQATVVPDATAPVTVTVMGRGVSLEQVRLVLIADLHPYWQGQERYVADLAARHPDVRPEDLDLPAAHGLQAHRALIEFCLRDSAESRARLQARRRRPRRSGRSAERQQVWEAAVRAQMHLAGQQRQEADGHVSHMVNQLVDLAGNSSWWHDAALQAAAIEEVLGYQVFGAAVASRDAQQAWLRARSRRAGLLPTDPAGLSPDSHEELLRRADELRGLERQAQRAWDAWADSR
jgi:hypothetical protein